MQNNFFSIVKNQVKWPYLIFVCLVLGIIFVAQYVNFNQLIEILSKADLTLIAVALVLETVSLAVRTLKWKVLVDEVKKVDFVELFKIQLAVTAISNLTPARIGETTKAVYMEKTGLKKRFTLLTILWERLFDLIAIVAFSLLIVSSYGSLIALFLLLLAVIVILTHNLQRIAKFVSKISQLAFLSDFGLHKFKKRILLKSLALSIVGWFFSLLAIAIAFQATGVVLPFEQVMGAFAISLIIGTISTIPGGFGSLEATLYLLLRGTYPLPMLVAAFIVARIVSIGLAFALGGIAAFSLSKSKRY